MGSANPASTAMGATLTMALSRASLVEAISDNFVPSGPTRRTLGYPSTFNLGAERLKLLIFLLYPSNISSRIEMTWALR